MLNNQESKRPCNRRSEEMESDRVYVRLCADICALSLKHELMQRKKLVESEESLRKKIIKLN